jgi:hypothetical protein
MYAKLSSSQARFSVIASSETSSGQLFIGLYAVFFFDAMRNNPHEVMGIFVSSDPSFLFHAFFPIERLRYFR